MSSDGLSRPRVVGQHWDGGLGTRPWGRFCQLACSMTLGKSFPFLVLLGSKTKNCDSPVVLSVCPRSQNTLQMPRAASQRKESWPSIRSGDPATKSGRCTRCQEVPQSSCLQRREGFMTLNSPEGEQGQSGSICLNLCPRISPLVAARE